MNSTDIINSRRLIMGPHNELMAVSPLKHKWAWDILDVMEKNTWFPREIDLSRDIVDYRFRLTDAERNMYDKALAFLSNLDGIQFNNLTNNIGRFITSPEVSMCIARQAWEEAVHVKSYAAMIEAVSADPMSVYMTFQRDGMLAVKNEYILRQSRMLGEEFSARNFALAVIANMILEGIYFYSGFLAFYVLGRNGKMLGSVDMIRYIQRDEGGTHLTLFASMLRTLREENPEIFDEEFERDALQLIKEGVELESAWGRHIIKDGVMGITDAVVDDYIQHLGNLCATRAELPLPYPGVKNPVAWVDEFSKIKGVETNFFEGKPTNYSVGGLEW